MASAWGTSWGASWGSSWGAIAVEPVNPQPQVWAGGDYREYRDYLATGSASISLRWSARAAATTFAPVPLTPARAPAPSIPLVVIAPVELPESSASGHAQIRLFGWRAGKIGTMSVTWDSSAKASTTSMLVMTASSKVTVEDRRHEDALIAVAAYMLKRRRLARK